VPQDRFLLFCPLQAIAQLRLGLGRALRHILLDCEVRLANFFVVQNSFRGLILAIAFSILKSTNAAQIVAGYE
jgi:hypothetical protein